MNDMKSAFPNPVRLYSFNKCYRIFHWRFGKDAVTEIRDVTLCSEAFDHLPGLLANNLFVFEQHRRIEVSLQCDLILCKTSCSFRVNSPVDAHCGSTAVHQLIKFVAAIFCKENGWNSFVDRR